MILVTGGAGYIGSFMTRLLCERGERVVVFDDMSAGFAENLDPRAEFVRGDVCDPAALEKLFRGRPFREIFHFAGKIRVEESVRLPELYHRVNTGGTRLLFEKAKELCPTLKAFVFSSTASVYGNPDKTPIPETARVEPINPYGESKLNAEKELRSLARGSGIKLVILRYFNVAGAATDLKLGQRDRTASHLIKVACEVAIGRRAELQVFGTDYPTRDGSGERDFIHVEDLVDIHRHAADWILASKTETITMNCGYGRAISVLEVAKEIGRLAGRPLPLKHAPRRAGDPGSICADVTQLETVLRWKPRHASLAEICGSALEWERKLDGGSS